MMRTRIFAWIAIALAATADVRPAHAPVEHSRAAAYLPALPCDARPQAPKEVPACDPCVRPDRPLRADAGDDVDAAPHRLLSAGSPDARRFCEPDAPPARRLARLAPSSARAPPR